MNDERWFERDRQVIRARALVDMLAEANAEELPPMRWTVNAAAGSCLHGETDWPLDHNPEQTFQAWVDWLGLKPGKSSVSTLDERMERRASGTYKSNGHDVPIGVLMRSNERVPR